MHDWNLGPDDAIHLQENLRQKLSLSWDERPVTTIGGVDFIDAGESTSAAVSVFRFPSLTRLVTVTAQATPIFPYIPGLLAFRLGPAILGAWEELTNLPDVLIVHGHGIAHPRGLGLASQLGLWLNLPCIGVAKRRLYGFHAGVGTQVGDWSELLDESNSMRVIGAALRTRLHAKPVYVSPGHLIDLQHAVQLVLACCKGFRLPVPLRVAHEAAVHSMQTTFPISGA